MRWWAAVVVAVVAAVLPVVRGPDGRSAQPAGWVGGASSAPVATTGAAEGGAAVPATDVSVAGALAIDASTIDAPVPAPAVEVPATTGAPPPPGEGNPATTAVPSERPIPPPPAVFGGPVAATTAAPPAQLAVDGPPAGGVWAVIIGIDDYPGHGYDLAHAVSDAEAVDQALARFGVRPERRLVLRDGQADRATVLAAVRWLVERAGPDATAVFFYAGHVRHLGGETQALVTAEGDLITDQELAVRFGALSARYAWFLLATCYAGGFTELLGPGRVLTAAADDRSLAYENSDLGGSYLVHHLVREGWLEGRAGPTVQGAFAHADRAILERYPHRRPVQVDRAGAPIRLDVTPAPTPAPAPGPTPTPAPAPTAGGDPSPGRSAPPTTQAPAPPPTTEPAPAPAPPGAGRRPCLLCRR